VFHSGALALTLDSNQNATFAAASIHSNNSASLTIQHTSAATAGREMILTHHQSGYTNFSRIRLYKDAVGGGSQTGSIRFDTSHNATLYSNVVTIYGTGGMAINTGISLASGIDMTFAADGTSDIGSTGVRAANVWSDLINGADYGYDNGWRTLESDTYKGYGKGIAFDFGDHFKEGEALGVTHVS
jgi:hypothetical protein